MTAVPMYVFTGFLESGKTRFIQQTLEDPRFNSGERTLLLVLEEGEEEYDLSTYPSKNVYIETLDYDELSQEKLEELLKKHRADRAAYDKKQARKRAILKSLREQAKQKVSE